MPSGFKGEKKRVDVIFMQLEGHNLNSVASKIARKAAGLDQRHGGVRLFLTLISILSFWVGVLGMEVNAKHAPGTSVTSFHIFKHMHATMQLSTKNNTNQ